MMKSMHTVALSESLKKVTFGAKGKECQREATTITNVVRVYIRWRGSIIDTISIEVASLSAHEDVRMNVILENNGF